MTRTDNKFNFTIKAAFAVFMTVFVNGCTNTSHTSNSTPLSESYLSNQNVKKDSPAEESLIEEDNDSQDASMTNLEAIQRDDIKLKSEQLSMKFNDNELLTVSVNNMTIKSFLHYVFGELLEIDYVIGNKIQESPISLNITHQISRRKLFELSMQVLQERGVGIRLKDNIYFVYQLPTGGKSNVVIGFGRDIESIPQNSGQILQVVPLKYGIRISVERTLRGLVDAKITADFEQGALFIQGRRDQVVRAIDLIKLLDVPANRGKHIALISPVYLSTENFITSITKLLQAEGIDVGNTPQKKENLVFIPLAQLGSVAVFSAEKDLLERVEYWTSHIDQPSKGTERQYHVYTPKFARASDLGASIAPLIGNMVNSGGVENDASAKDGKTSALINNNQNNVSVTSNDKMSLVIDKRSNTLIFHSSGSEYQSILPLVRRMDTMPKQVLLSVTIAEVKLQGVFKRGFEFALTSGNFGASTKGALGVDGIAGLALNWSSGLDSVVAKFIEENSYVNILSKPSILVRDGTEATINVGDKVPVSSGSTTGSNGDLVTENISYTETGIRLKVSPTVNAQGVVIMKIIQDISNQVEGQVGQGGNPLFFERNIQTEVVAESGQTILLGGLISENISNNDKGVPVLKSIPLIGALFESESKSNTKQELVIMVTPKIVERSQQWQGILNSFQNVLESIKITADESIN